MKIEMHRGTHHLAWQENGGDGYPKTDAYSEDREGDAAQAEQRFWGLVQNANVNWVKFWTIRRDGNYIFNAEFQKRTPRK